MRILHLIDDVTRKGGAQLYVRSLAEAQEARGDDVAVFHGGSDELPPPIVTGPLGSDAPTKVREFRPDVVHVHDTPLPPDVEEELRGREAVVRTFHSFDFGCSAGTHYFRSGEICTRAHGPGCAVDAVLKGCFHRLDARAFVRRYREIEAWLDPARATRTTVFPSHFIREVALRNGFAADRCHVVAPFAARAAAPAPLGEGRNVCFVGRVVRNKGLDLLIEALALRPDAWDGLFVVGDGWDRARCERLGERSGLSARIRFLGWRGPAEVLDVVRASTLVAVPSRWAEPFGLVGIEAMAQGRAVVATSVGGIPEWLVPGVNGLLVPPGDSAAMAEALESVLLDVDRARQLGSEGWRLAARYSVEHHLRALDDVYSRVRSGGEARPTQAVRLLG